MSNTGFFSSPTTQATSSAMASKRKRAPWCIEDYAFEQNKQMRLRSPRLDRRHTDIHSNPHSAPELVPDTSATASDEDQCMDQDMDMSSQPDQDMDMDDQSGVVGFEYENGAGEHTRIRDNEVEELDSRGQYAFGSSGSGGFGFGPGAMEDDDDDDETSKVGYQYQHYPSFTPHTNPHHFSNLTSSGTIRPKSPLSAQAFSTSLRAPRAPGLLQPTVAAPLGADATDVERARAQHGPQCRSIPKLVMSQYPDESGKRSLWSQCVDCGATERSM